jgi:hypothetical protein
MPSSPDKPLWDDPQPLFGIDRIDDGWFAIDGIPTVAGSRKHHQLLVIGRGGRLGRQWKWLLETFRAFLDLDLGRWNYQKSFLREFAGVFLDRHRDRVVWVQVLPQRKTFQTLHGASRHPHQTALAAEFQFHGVCLGDADLDLAYGLRIPGAGLLMGGRPGAGPADELWWTKQDVRRVLRTGVVTETRFFLAHADGDREFLRAGNVPALHGFFDEQAAAQVSALVSFCALSHSGRMVHSHCFSLHPESGVLLDIRQSKPPLAYHNTSAPHNEGGLKELLAKQARG